MPQTTYPNQREINIHRERATSNFLGIKNDNWMAASRALGAHALRLYLYLASNADGYRLALSPAAIQQQIGMPTSTYRDQFRKLESMRYIKHSHGNTYDFYEKPYDAAFNKAAAEKAEMMCAAPALSFEDTATAVDSGELPVDNLMREDREINNSKYENYDSINTTATASGVRTAQRADEIWPIHWDGYVDNPALMLTEEEARAIEKRQWEEHDDFIPPKGEFVF